MNKWLKVGLVLIPVVLMSACGSTGAKKAAPVTGGSTPPADTANTSPLDNNGGAGITPLPQTGGSASQSVDPLNDPASPLAKRVIYFEYDSNNIRAEDRATIEAHAQYLAQRGNLKVTLEGHADERGSREYNIALGERRSNAVKEVMSLLGVPAGQVASVSYGEERPAVLGDDESAWRMNRRVEIVYAGQ
ncbi:MAG: peptidoglycan-associated lipoprotein Pal [Pseudomonadota bacterium]